MLERFQNDGTTSISSIEGSFSLKTYIPFVPDMTNYPNRNPNLNNMYSLIGVRQDFAN